MPISTPTPTPIPTPAPEAHYGGIAGQDMALVGASIWVFAASDNHAPKAGWLRDAATLTLRGYFTQSFSHAGTVDYNAASNVLLIGNAGDTGSSAPRIDLLTGFSRYGVNQWLEWNDPVAVPRVSIPLLVMAADGVTVSRSAFPNLARRTASAVWGEDPLTVYAFGGSAAEPLTVVKLALGTGDRDLSAGPDGYGSYTPARSADEYNGTARVVAVYRSSLLGVTQGATWHDGALYLGWTVPTPAARTLEVLRLALGEGAVTIADRWRYVPPAGTAYTFETQGVLFRGEDLLVTGRRLADDYQSIYRFADRSTVVDLLP